MNAFITALHITACFALVAIVLLQHGKGADIGAAFGGGSSNTVFGARGASNFLTKVTTGCVIVFMLTSITLSYFTGPATVTDMIGQGEAVPEVVPEAPAPESSFPDAAPIDQEAPSGFESLPAPGTDPEP